MRFIFGIFILLHGLVHLLYFGHSLRYFELKPGMVWPDGSWILSRLISDQAARNLAGILLILAAIGYSFLEWNHTEPGWSGRSCASY
jgi:hypothetical protein